MFVWINMVDNSQHMEIISINSDGNGEQRCSASLHTEHAQLTEAAFQSQWQFLCKM